MQYVGTSVGVPTNKVQETIDAIRECYTEFLEEGMTQKEIDEKTDTLWFSAKRANQTSSNLVSAYAYDELYPFKKILHGPYPDVFNYRKTYTAEEIHAVLKKYITLDSYYLVVNGREVHNQNYK